MVLEQAFAGAIAPHSLLINLAFLLPEPTGITTYAAQIYPRLQALDPTLLIPQAKPSYRYHLVPTHMTSAQGLLGHGRRLLWTQRQLPEIYRQLGSRLLFSPLPEAPLGTNCRFVVMVHDLIPLRFPSPLSPLTYYYRYYLPRILDQAEHILCNSMATARDLGRFFGIAAHKISPILLAYDREHFRPLGESTQPYFLYLGRLQPYKNLQRLITAFAALELGPEYELWISGHPDRRFLNRYQRQVRQLGLSNRVKFLGYVPYSQLPQLLNRAIVLVFPSLWEGFGLPVLEAMACGTPVITSDRGALPEVVGDAALTVNPYLISGLTQAMGRVATEPQLRSDLRRAGLARAKNFSWEQTAQATLEVLQSFVI